ncbi:MAG: glycosyl transferase family 1 [Gammaproteobacteria bacterium]|nr:MAG: glycosyl transferase family 1 [Gammaproteobacteria bacterium]
MIDSATSTSSVAPRSGTPLPDSGHCPQHQRPLRVAILCDAVPGRNGVGAYYTDLCDQFEARGLRTLLLHPKSPKAGGYRYLSAPLPGDNTQRISMPRPLRLWRAVTRFRPDVLVTPTPGPFGLSAVSISGRLGIPLVTGFHTHYEALAEIYWHNWWGNVSRWYLTRCNHYMFDHSELVLANSPEMIEQARHFRAGDKVRLMGTSVPAELIDRPVAPLHRQPRRILFAGRLADEKNLPAIIDAARRHPDLRFTIAGDGPLMRWTRAQAAALPNLTVPGWIARDQLINAIDGHDVLLLPSKVESFGTVALEGMARGRLVMVSETCGIATWPELEGTLHVIRRDESASDSLSRLCAADADSRLMMASTARDAACALNRWNIDNWIARLEAVSKHHAGSLATLVETGIENLAVREPHRPARVTATATATTTSSHASSPTRETGRLHEAELDDA